MTNLFFYGSLRDEALLRIVLGDDRAQVRLHGAELADHAVHWVKGQGFPMILPVPGQSAKGVLAMDLTPTHIARLNFYEGGFDYTLCPHRAQVDGQLIDCHVYFPPPGKYAPGAPWHLSDWQSEWGALSRIAAVEAMSYFGTIDAATLQRRFPMIRARAASQLRARTQSAPLNLRKGLTEKDLTVQSRTRSHAGFFALDVMQLRHTRFDGTPSDLLQREVFLGCDAAIVLPYDPVTDRVLLVEQFRMGPTGRGDPVPWCLEPVAGLIDPGETPEDTARREAREEAGLELRALEPVAQGYSSPGASSEYFFLFVGLCHLPDMVNGQGGLPGEGEDIRTHILPLDRALDAVSSGEINILPTILCLSWLARHRDRLRTMT